MNQKVLMGTAIFAVFLWVLLGVFMVIPWQAAGVLVAVSIGIPTLLLHYERGKATESVDQVKHGEKQTKKEIIEPVYPAVESEFQNGKVETAPIEKKIQKRVLLLDRDDIAKLNIDNDLLSEIFEKARIQAIELYHDVQLSSFTIQVFPFASLVSASVTIYFTFYTKWADKTCTFRYSDIEPRLIHSLPDYRAKDADRAVLGTMPWKENPHWAQFIKRAFMRITPFSPALATCYHLIVAGYDKDAPWRLTFEDGFSGNDYTFVWNGKGLDEDSIKLVH